MSSRAPFWPAPEVTQRYHEALVKLVREAHGEQVEIAGWLAEALGEVAGSLPGGAESLLTRRPGSWEADLTRQLINNTIGWPDQASQVLGPVWDFDEFHDGGRGLPGLPESQRPAQPGELCTCGRQAVFVYLTQKWGEVGDCGRSDGGRGGPKPCPFCQGAIKHGPERCPQYRLRPEPPDLGGTLADAGGGDDGRALPESPLSAPAEGSG